MSRQCGTCSLCCVLLPVAAVGKAANTACQHQRFGKGCAIHATKPLICSMWDCLWLQGDADSLPDIRRPDRVGYVIDPSPDFVRMPNPDNDGEVLQIEVVQIWVDPKRPEAHHDKALRAWLNDRQEIGLVRFGDRIARLIVPPSHPSNETNAWFEQDTDLMPEDRRTMLAVQAERDRLAAAAMSSGGTDAGAKGNGVKSPPGGRLILSE